MYLTQRPGNKLVEIMYHADNYLPSDDGRSTDSIAESQSQSKKDDPNGDRTYKYSIRRWTQLITEVAHL